MVWIWSLIALGIVVGATGQSQETDTTGSTTTAASARTPEPTTVDPYTALDKTITDDLENILTKYERECMGNSEFTRNLDLIRKAVKLDKSRLLDKIEARIEFNKYNEQRILIERQIDERIEALNNILPTQEPNSYCSEFYLKQREDLRKAKSLSNLEKLNTLLINKAICTIRDNYYDDDSLY
ncbi:uncharacterized protein LOC27207649 isoform X3 [Drosophila simulans]|uniref:uncharacterized protein LOC27207649 isoform X3 n=1 Tax=Drosophila simulans TaxID=7240 RepID=UPI001D0FFB45|nr:uncharacterized protein LOC27207649 isoform X3 [Drosophila simulans]